MAKIDIAKIEEADKLLFNIIQAIQAYERYSNNLTKQEKALAGGIVYNASSKWSDFSSLGTIGDRDFTSFLMETLLAYFQHPEAFVSKKQSPFKIDEDNVKN